MREFERRFDAEHRMSLREFDVLINLDDAPPEGLRMTALAARTMLSSGGLTRLAGRLEDRGLMRRTPDPDDARAFRARLTERGAAVLEAMRATHDDAVRELFGRALGDDDLATLRRLLERDAEAAPPPSAGPVQSPPSRRARTGGAP